MNRWIAAVLGGVAAGGGWRLWIFCRQAAWLRPPRKAVKGQKEAAIVGTWGPLYGQRF